MLEGKVNLKLWVKVKEKWRDSTLNLNNLGYNIKELATKYGYTEKWVRKILKENIDNNP